MDKLQNHLQLNHILQNPPLGINFNEIRNSFLCVRFCFKSTTMTTSLRVKRDKISKRVSNVWIESFFLA